jgi:dihydroorotase
LYAACVTLVQIRYLCSLMNLLIKSATILCKNSAHHGKKRDILVENGIIKKIASSISISKKIQTIEHKDLCVSAGFFELFANFCDPGAEHKETIQSGAGAAQAGGYTQVCIVPNTKPGICSKAQVEYAIRQGAATAVDILPLGAVSAQLQGAALAEMLDMHASGAVAFTDGISAVQEPGLLLKALQYVKSFNGTIVQLPLDSSIAKHGQMHEGITSTRLGMPGIPAVAEEIMIARDLSLLEYTGSRLHITGVSTAKGVAAIAQAKKKGLHITCSVTPYHLLFTDDTLYSYDSVYKVMPPLRSEADRKALVKGLASGIIDAIATHHAPQDWDAKTIEFEYAQAGMMGLETALLSLLPLQTQGVALEKIVEALGNGARACLALPEVHIAENQAAQLCLFTTASQQSFEAKDIKSKAHNTPFLNATLSGRILGTVHKAQFITS